MQRSDGELQQSQCLTNPAITDHYLQYALTQKSQSHVLELCTKYPINNAPEYPDKRVFKIGDRAWELTDLRLKVWAAHLVRCTIEYLWCQS